jgi:type VI secretion system secreted protein Hcp
MALNAYLKLKGQKQGEIKGSVTQKGREGKIMVIASNHSIISPRDAASGLPTGKRMHKPFIITKELDRSSPLLYNALVNNENITEWELQFWQPGPTGTEIQHYTVKLTNANIASIEFNMPNNKDPLLMKYAEYEEVAFTYQKIEWVWVNGGITAMDDWASPV